MEINWFAFFIVVIISFSVMLKKDFTYLDAFVFFIPFNATVVFFTPDGTAINLPFTLFFLAALAYFFRKFFSHKFLIPKNRLTASTWLLFIGIIAIVSQVMPYIINGNFMVLDRYEQTVYWAKEKPLYPSLQWLTQTIYFLIGLLVVFIISVTYKTLEDVKKVLKLFIFGITFMIFWGWFADLTYFLNLPYPQIFNHIGMYEFGVAKEAFNGFPRMVSVTMEASYFAQILIPITPFFYWFHQQEKSFLFNTKFNKWMYILCLVTLPIAITTTGVLGFFVLTGLWLVNNVRFFSKRSKYFLIIMYAVLLIIAITFVVNYMVQVSGTYSGIERFKTVHYGAIYFLSYPVLGLGFGVFPTYDLLINLLVNFGLLGTIPFFILMYNIFVKLKSRIKRASIENQPLFRAGIESFVLILIVSQLSGFIYHSQYFWLYIGIAISIASLKTKKNCA